jgi:multimeric flavodoxin WrbA
MNFTPDISKYFTSLSDRIIMILGLCGSPRAKTTEYVLKKALNTLEEKGYDTIFWSVRGKKIGFCLHCDYCLKEKKCIIKDDMQDLYPVIEEAEAVIMATPVYSGGVSAQLKAVLDRTRALFSKNPKALKNKPCIGIAIGGDRAGGQELALLQLHSFYLLTEAIPLSGGAFGANLGASLWSKDSMEGIKQDDYGMKNVNKTVKNLIEYLENNQ